VATGVRRISAEKLQRPFHRRILLGSSKSPSRKWNQEFPSHLAAASKFLLCHFEFPAIPPRQIPLCKMGRT
jgi:hypothetical protein